MSEDGVPAGDQSQAEALPPWWRDNPFAQQIAAEIGELQGIFHDLGGVRSYLEIGASFGWSAFLVAQVMPKGGKIRLIDLGSIEEVTAGKAWGFDIKPYLDQRIAMLRERELDIEIFYGDSHSVEAIRWARDNGPYQLVGIDGDHSYEGARADWENYGHLGEYVWLHDIANPKLGVMRLWGELENEYRWRTSRIVYPMGIGLVRRTKQAND